MPLLWFNHLYLGQPVLNAAATLYSLFDVIRLPATMDQAIQGGLPPPPGVKPDFVHPYTVQPFIKLCLALCIGLSTVFVWLRMYTKLFITRTPAWEDCEYCCPTKFSLLKMDRYFCSCLGTVPTEG